MWSVTHIKKKNSVTLRLLTLTSQILLQELIKALWSFKFFPDMAEVIVGHHIVLWVSHDIDNLQHKDRQKH